MIKFWIAKYIAKFLIAILFYVAIIILICIPNAENSYRKYACM